MVYIRKKKIKGQTYYYAVEGIYDDKGKQKQKIIRYLGNTQKILEKFEFWDKNH